MLKKEITFLNRIRKILACQIENCGQNIVFTDSENDIKFLDKDMDYKLDLYDQFLRTVKIKSTDWETFNKLMGKSKLEMSKSTYSLLFAESKGIEK